MTAPNHHPRHQLDPVLANGLRLSVVAALQGVERAEFALVRDLVEISDATLSKQVAALEAVGYVDVEKGRVGRRPRTWLHLTTAGEQALARHLGALQAIANLAVVGPDPDATATAGLSPAGPGRTPA